MRCSFTPYEGNEKYIFVSYAHKDGDLVKPILEKMYEAGFRIWYDDGIEWGTEYSEYIAKHLENCTVCLVFHSQKSKDSQYCKDEIYYALDNKKGILSVYLEDVILSSGLKMRLGSYQSTFWYQYPDADRKLFYERLLIAEILQPCKGEVPKTREAEDEIVKFHDADFEKAFREKYGIKGNIALKTILGFTELNLSNSEPKLRDISDIAIFKNLTSLILQYNQISNIKPLAGLVNLTDLYLSSNKISDIAPLAGLVNLTVLDLRFNQISDITPLAGLVKLTELGLRDNQISDMTPLAGLVKLTKLYLHYNRINDITPLAGLVKLTELGLRDNQISDMTPLAGLVKLTELDLRDNSQISNVQQRELKTRLPYTYIRW